MDFFDEIDYTKCLDCGTKDITDRVILWTTEEGDHEWICPACAAKREEEDARQEQEQANKINFMLNMD